MEFNQRFVVGSTLIAAMLVAACSGGGSEVSATGAGPAAVPTDALDITDAIFSRVNGDCAVYADAYTASVLDIQRSMAFEGSVSITAGPDSCALVSNAIPNHDFNDAGARFADAVVAASNEYILPREPSFAASVTPLHQSTLNGVMLNGVVLDILSAACYRPDDPQADAEGNVPVGCHSDSPWLVDPLGAASGFGTDTHNAHTQPGGVYHYHGNPKAMFDDFPGPEGSPVIGFAADGFPIYGSYFYDSASGQVRKALSGYALKRGARPVGAGDPGGVYDGTYRDDYEYTGAGDLDECNGMTVEGQYGYYVTDTYPWVIACHKGTPDESFRR